MVSKLVIGVVSVVVLLGLVSFVFNGEDSKKGKLTKIAESVPQELSVGSKFVEVASDSEGTNNLLKALAPGEGQEVLSQNFDQEGDSLSGSIETRVEGVVDFDQIETSFRNLGKGWESGDISSGGDSFDGTFEKTYPVVTIAGQKYIPSASVTISITIEDDGYTYTNYDVDITLEEIEENSSGDREIVEDSLDDEDEEDNEPINPDDL